MHAALSRTSIKPSVFVTLLAVAGVPERLSVDWILAVHGVDHKTARREWTRLVTYWD